jgi:hypothetical protein
MATCPDIAGTNLIEMTAGPTHGRLHGQVQGLDRVEGDLEAGDGDRTHAATFRISLSLAQFQGKSSLSLWMA